MLGGSYRQRPFPRLQDALDDRNAWLRCDGVGKDVGFPGPLAERVRALDWKGRDEESVRADCVDVHKTEATVRPERPERQWQCRPTRSVASVDAALQAVLPYAVFEAFERRRQSHSGRRRRLEKDGKTSSMQCTRQAMGDQEGPQNQIV